jgi:preprotein translocase subunit YajC
MFSNSYVAMLALGGPPAGSSPEEQKKAMFMQMGMMVFFGVIFYVMLIRPQQKRAKEQAKMLSELKAGDKVTTTSGIVGIVVGIKDNSVTLRSGESKLEITKGAIGEVVPGTSAP